MLCSVCYAEEFNISSYSLDLESLCKPHWQDWAKEKMAYEYLD